VINPTGTRIRNDATGNGQFGAARGARTHAGLDLLCSPGQEVVSPIEGVVTRWLHPYSDDDYLTGILIEGRECNVRLYYVRPLDGLIGVRVNAGEPIGRAQDVRTHYPGAPMLPHVHLEVRQRGKLIDPEPLLKGAL
jgi:murein DD-endopeptidase MepM/ murein hydrolase activator NlpD